jgi:hypothetical protein
MWEWSGWVWIGRTTGFVAACYMLIWSLVKVLDFAKKVKDAAKSEDLERELVATHNTIVKLTCELNRLRDGNPYRESFTRVDDGYETDENDQRIVPSSGAACRR